MTKKLKILHLEDLPGDAEFVDRQLRKSDLRFDKIVVDTKDEFIEALDKFTPDIVLSDHSLPAFNSLEALKIIRQKGIDIPFILITATVSEEFAVRMMQEGATDYILKDRLQRLPNAIISAIEKQDLAKEQKKIIENVIANASLMKEAERLAHFGSWEYHVDSRSLIFSDEMYRILDYDRSEITPTRFAFLKKVHVDDQQLLRDTVEKIYAGSENIPELVFRIFDNNNSVKYLHSEVLILKRSDGSIYKIIGFCQDITDVKNKERELIASSENLRELALHLQNIREEERSSIAREIHDALGQELTAIKIDVAWLLKKLDDSPAALKEKAKGVIELLNSSIASVRKIATQLRPTLLDDLGLNAALQWQSEEFEKRTGIIVHFSSDYDLKDTRNNAIAIFRIYQESLTNIARHAEASRVDAVLKHEDNALTLTIHDNGKGFDLGSISQKRTLGLLGMKERTIMMGGAYNITSSPGKGTTVHISVPV
ncbi:MAG TPA: histidine kinase [Panacibacter sp.]|nr:histidine kinase [Panacibacter sp.]HNP45445.1 histidine kinase [Panacibacter sp.]